MNRRLKIVICILAAVLTAGCNRDIFLPDQADHIPAEGSKISISSLINLGSRNRHYVIEGSFSDYNVTDNSFMVADNTGRIKVKSADNIDDWREIFGKEGAVAVSGRLDKEIHEDGRTVFCLENAHIEDVTTNVMIFFAAAFNNLSSDIKANLKTMLSCATPERNSPCKLILVTHFSPDGSHFGTPAKVYVEQAYRESSRGLVRDTVYSTDASSILDPDIMKGALAVVKERFPSADFGMIMSSHGTGWLPQGYYGGSSTTVLFDSPTGHKRVLPLYRRNSQEGPRVKTFGAEVLVRDGQRYSQEMDITALAQSIPMHLSYLLFDACLMGTIEVAYELRNVTDKLAASPAEVLSYGFDYTASTELVSRTPSIEKFCEAYFNMYNNKTGINRSATISVINTGRLDEFAALCSELFAKYRGSLSALGIDSGIQQYYRYDNHWFYDIEDILNKAGISSEDKSRFDAALDACISYKAATPSFLKGSGGFDIGTFSGLSMYLPSAGNSSLSGNYKSLAWNKATNLVE